MGSNHLFLTGYRGCGKTSVGKRLAEVLNRPFLDTDEAIEKAAGKSIAQIFAETGESSFRDLESNQIELLKMASSDMVVSLGGGAILRQSNREIIKASGLAVWLQASPETICSRIANDSSSAHRRPKLSKLGDLEEIKAILEARLPCYHEVASLCIQTDGLSTDSIADRIVTWLQANS